MKSTRAVALACVLAFAGCTGGTGKGGATPGQDGPRAGPAEAAVFDVRDPVAVSRVRERAIEAVERASRSEDAQVRANAVEAAGLAPRRLMPVVSRALDDRHWAVRSVALMVAGRTKDASVAARARTFLADPSPHIRASAIYALAGAGQAVDQTPLATILLSDTAVSARSHAAFVLGEIGNASALPVLREAVRDPLPSAGNAAARLFYLQCSESMVKLGDQSQRSPIRAALYPSSPEELEAAALAVQILGQVKDRESIDQLIYLASYKDPQGQPMPAEVRLGVAAALARMGLRQGGFIADEFVSSPNPALRAQAAFVYGETGGAAAWGRLERMLEDQDAGVRVAAAAGVLKLEAGREPR